MGKIVFTFWAVLAATAGTLASGMDEVKQLHQKAYTYLDTDYDSAFLLAERAGQLSEDAGDPYLQAQSIFIQSYIHRMRDEMGKSFVLNLTALDLLEGESNRDAVQLKTQLYLNSGEVLFKHYAYDQAALYYDRGLDLAVQYALQPELVKLLYNKAMALESAKRFDEGLLVINHLLRISYESDDEYQIVETLNSKGLLLGAKGDYELAEEVFLEIISSGIKGDEAYFQGMTWHNLGYVYAEKGELLKARAAYEKALHWRYKENAPRKFFITYKDLAETHYKLGAYTRADSLARLAASHYNKVLSTPENYDLYDLQTKLDLKLNRSDEALISLEQYKVENDRFLQTQRDILQVKDRYKMELLTAGFFAELEARHTRDRLMDALLWVSIVFVTILVLGRLRFLYTRWSIRKALSGIERESGV